MLSRHMAIGSCPLPVGTDWANAPGQSPTVAAVTPLLEFRSGLAKHILIGILVDVIEAQVVTVAFN